MVQFRCNRGYFLQGPKSVLCLHGRLKGDRPVCAKRGCASKPEAPEHGAIEVERSLQAVLTCDEDYIIAGNHLAYCDGKNWDRPIGTCRATNHTHDHSCDFETEDLCGWTTDRLFFGFQWRRVVATNIFRTFKTGPRHDHTTKTADGGHYMLMESVGETLGPLHLISPIYIRELSLKTACCFKFYYFMYGEGVGNLYIFVKPRSVTLEIMWAHRDIYGKFFLSGNQNNQWNEHTIFIDEMDEDFNIVISTSESKSHLGDVAIDDVKLMTGADCQSEYSNTTSSAIVSEATEEAIFDQMSCKDRCGLLATRRLQFIKGKIYETCSCHSECVEEESCCLDYILVCVNDTFETTINADDSEDTTRIIPTTIVTIPSTTIPTTTTGKTTKLTTTTSTTTTTTTRKPTTKMTTMMTTPSTTTSTTTTRKPTTTTTTTRRPTTSTTTRKPTTKTTTTTTTTTKRTTIPTTTETPTTTTTPTTKTTTTIPTTTSKQLNKPTTSTPSKLLIATTKPTRSSTAHNPSQTQLVDKIVWKISPEDIHGHAETPQSTDSSRTMYLLLIVIVITICMATVGYRCKNHVQRLFKDNGQNTEVPGFHSVKASFTQRLKDSTYATVLKFKGRRSYSDDYSEPLWDDDAQLAEGLNGICLERKVSEL